MNAKEIGLQLLKMQDKEYSAFQARIIPSVKKEKIIGVRTPQLRTLAKTLAKEEDTESFQIYKEALRGMIQERLTQWIHCLREHYQNRFEGFTEKTED